MNDTIDLQDVMRALIRRWPIFLAGFLVGGVIVFLISTFFLPRTYLSSVELYVNNMETKSTGDVTTGDIDASRRLSNTYIVVLQNPAVEEDVVEEVGGALTIETLERVVKMEAVADTEVIRISAETEDPALSTRICNTYAGIAPRVLERVVQAGSVEIIGRATANEEPASPHISRNTAIGALAGLFLTIVVLYIVNMLDNTVKGGADLRQRIDVPVLGEISSFVKTGKADIDIPTMDKRRRKRHGSKK
ncbi:MAG: hypothetical protein LBL63_02125 [Clostridiales Family XIII bacterium]|nr:hypothetical protein [Clostridiales Family XIII bacterium]